MTQIASAAVQFFLGVYIANALGVESYAKYAAVVAFVAAFAGFLSMGVELVAIRDIAQDRSAAPKYLGAILLWHASLNLVVGAMVLTLAFVFRYAPDIRHLMTLFFISTAFNNLGTAASIVLQGLERFELVGTLALGNVLVLAGTVVAAIGMGGGIEGVLLSLITAAALNAVILVLVATRVGGGCVYLVNPAFFRRLVLRASPLAVVSILGTASSRIDRALLSRLAPLAFVGMYAAAFAMVQGAVDLLWSTVNKVIYPLTSRAGLRGMGHIKRTTELLLVVFTSLFLYVAISTQIMADLVVDVLYSDGFQSIADALRVLIWLPLPLVAWAIYRNVLLVADERQVYAKLMALDLLVTTALTVVLVVSAGWLGAAYGAVASKWVLLAVTATYVHRKYGSMLPVGGLVRLMGAGLIGAVAAQVTWLLNSSPVPVWSVFTVSFGASVVLLGVIDVKATLAFLSSSDHTRNPVSTGVR